MDLLDHQEYIYLPLLTVGEAARYLGVGRKIIYQLIEYELLKTVGRIQKIGSRYRPGFVREPSQTFNITNKLHWSCGTPQMIMDSNC